MFHVKRCPALAIRGGSSAARRAAGNRGRERPCGFRRPRSQTSRHHLRRGAGAGPIQPHGASTRQSATAAGGQLLAHRHPVDAADAASGPGGARPGARRAWGTRPRSQRAPEAGQQGRAAGCSAAPASPRSGDPSSWHGHPAARRATRPSCDDHPPARRGPAPPDQGRNAATCHPARRGVRSRRGEHRPTGKGWAQTVTSHAPPGEAPSTRPPRPRDARHPAARRAPLRPHHGPPRRDGRSPVRAGLHHRPGVIRAVGPDGCGLGPPRPHTALESELTSWPSRVRHRPSRCHRCEQRGVSIGV